VPSGRRARNPAGTTGAAHHEFWPDGISVLDESRFQQSRWLGSRQITDAYLLALAVMRGAEPRHLVVI
jgi:hypothetical protein